MTESAEPFDGGPDLSQSGWTEIWSAAILSGVTPVPLNSLQVFSDNDGRQVKVRAGSAVMRGTRYASDAVKAINIPVNTGADRLDMIVLRLDIAAKKISSELKPGTSGQVSPPSLTQVPGGVWEIPLGIVPVPSGFTSIPISGAIQDVRHFAGPNVSAGEIVPFAAAVFAPGFIPADGRLLHRAAYPALFAYMGTLWGAGDGVSTFALPDLRERTMYGAGSGGFAIGATGGSAIKSVPLPAHTHPFPPGYQAVVSSPVGESHQIATSTASGNTNVTYSDIPPVGTSGATMDITPPYAAVNLQIKAH
jgi:microcystin-dependent protein